MKTTPKNLTRGGATSRSAPCSALFVTAEQEAEIRREYPKYFRLQKRLFPEKKPDPTERELLERIQKAIERVEVSIKSAKELNATRYAISLPNAKAPAPR